MKAASRGEPGMTTVFKCTGCGLMLNIRRFILQATIQCPGCGRVDERVFTGHRRFFSDPPVEVSGRIARDFPTVAIEPAAPAPAVPVPQPPEPPVEATGRIARDFPTAPVEPAPLPIATSAAGVPSEPPLLTAPHHCHQCSASLDGPIGKRADTVVCPSCEEKTSAYAIFHRCPECTKTLESPTRLCGAWIPCPACRHYAIVPFPVLHLRPIDEEVDLWFWCRCPNCQSRAAVRKEDVGVWGACPSCLWPMQAPMWGERPEGDDVLAVARNVRCPGCQMQVPLAAQSCPLCHASLTSCG